MLKRHVEAESPSDGACLRHINAEPESPNEGGCLRRMLKPESPVQLCSSSILRGNRTVFYSSTQDAASMFRKMQPPSGRLYLGAQGFS